MNILILSWCCFVCVRGEEVIMHWCFISSIWFCIFKGVLLGTYVEKHMFKIIFFFFVCFLFKYELTLLLFVALFHASLTSSLLLIMEIAIYVKLSLYFNSINYLNIWSVWVNVVFYLMSLEKSWLMLAAAQSSFQAASVL